MKALVTGGAGFIGSHLVDSLIAKGVEVIVLDSLSSGYVKNINSQAEFVKGDVRDQELITSLMGRVDVCYHLAAMVSIIDCSEHWVDSVSVNVAGTVSVLNAAFKHKRGGVVPVVYASSCAVYGDNQELPLNESSLPSPISSYGVSKLCCELEGKLAYKAYGVPSMGLRPFNVYGHRQNPDCPYAGVVVNFVEHASRNEPFSIYGDGFQTRDFIYVADVVDYFIRSMDFLAEEPGAYVANVCTGQQTTINELALIIADEAGCSVEMSYLESRAGDIRFYYGDASYANKLIGQSLGWSLKLGLAEMLSHYDF